MASGVDRTSRALCYSAAAPIHRASERARPARSHLQGGQRERKGEERVNPDAKRERLAGLARSLALGEPVPCPPSRQRRRAHNCAEITSRTFTPRSPPNASPTPSSANSPASIIPAFASPAARKPRAANPMPGNTSAKAAGQLPFTAPRKPASSSWSPATSPPFPALASRRRHSANPSHDLFPDPAERERARQAAAAGTV